MPARTANRTENRQRLMEIMDVVRRHDLTRGITPEKLCAVIEDLGPTFIKLGQILSMRSDILPKSYCEALSRLLSSVAPMPYEQVVSIIERSYGRPLTEVFSSFDERALGSASIAQAHAAVLTTGESVVVKVQREGIHDVMSRDIMLLKQACKVLKYTPASGLVDFNQVLDEMWVVAQEEMNFQTEAANLEKFRRLNEDVAFVTSPALYREYTTTHVLVMERIDGYGIDDKAALSAAGSILRMMKSGIFKKLLHGFDLPAHGIGRGAALARAARDACVEADGGVDVFSEQRTERLIRFQRQRFERHAAFDAFAHDLSGNLVSRPEGHALPGQIVGAVGCSHEAVFSGPAHGGGVRRPGGDHRREHGQAGFDGIGRVERGFLILLHVLVIGKRQALEHRQRAHQVAVDAAGFSARQLGHVAVFLLRHDARAGGKRVVERDEMELPRAPQQNLLRQPRKVHHQDRPRGAQLGAEIAVAHRVETVCAGRVEAEQRGGHLPVDGIGSSGERARANKRQEDSWFLH